MFSKEKPVDDVQTNRVLNVEWANDVLKSRGWKLLSMPGSGIEPRNDMYVVADREGKDSGIRFRPFTHTDSMRGQWYIAGREPSEDVYIDDAWAGRGWEPFQDLNSAIAEKTYYELHGLQFDEQPSQAAARRRSRE